MPLSDIASDDFWRREREKEIIANIQREPERFGVHMGTGQIFFSSGSDLVGVLERQDIPWRKHWEQQENLRNAIASSGQAQIGAYKIISAFSDIIETSRILGFL
ncbi:hypothetical protein HY493_03805 [Candidatus Woesearchaeota archaeon]|nr:hypothetical protein [Candidatus Woesearchaeota archaeon]